MHKKLDITVYCMYNTKLSNCKDSRCISQRLLK